MKPVLIFDNVSKRYAHHIRRPDSVIEAILDRLRISRRRTPDDFWVVRDLSLKIHPAEAVGLVGDNGVGKSTILKLAAHIVSPTSGSVTLSGRVGALLEVGVGFHPDLTGRENIYLSGSIIGIERKDMARRLDEIVAFSELEDFIDMPVRYYSSGMHVRLGFAVATAVDPDVLLVDEVLSVGDISFREKCLRRIQALQKQGTAIFYVSHNLDEVRAICDRVLWLRDARVVSEGSPDDVVKDYLRYAWRSRDLSVWELGDAEERGRKLGQGGIRFLACGPVNATGMAIPAWVPGEALKIRVDYETERVIPQMVMGISIYTTDGVRLIAADSQPSHDLPAGTRGSMTLTLPSLSLRAGRYELTVSAHDPSAEDYTPYAHYQRAYELTVLPGTDGQEGLVQVPFQWSQADPSRQEGSAQKGGADGPI